MNHVLQTILIICFNSTKISIIIPRILFIIGAGMCVMFYFYDKKNNKILLARAKTKSREQKAPVRAAKAQTADADEDTDEPQDSIILWNLLKQVEGFSWELKNLPDLTVEIDYIRSEVTLSITDWQTETSINYAT